MNYLFFLKYLTYEAKLSTAFPSLFCHIISFTNKEIFPKKSLALTEAPPFLSHYSFVCLYVTPFSNPSPCQAFSVSLSLSEVLLSFLAVKLLCWC